MCTEQMEPFPALQLVMFKRWSSDEPPQLELSTGMRNLAPTRQERPRCFGKR